MREEVSLADPPEPAVGRVGLLYSLTKPGIVLYVVLTAAAAFWVGAQGAIDLIPFAHTIAGVWIATAGSLALNQYIERDLDGLMKRTRTRPLPSGRLRPAEALRFSILLLVVGIGWLWVAVGWLPALITAGAAVAYNAAYTPMKTRSGAATIVGSVPGALPALIGWAAATGELATGAWVLFAMAFLWQLPHVIGLAWLLRDDYQTAGIMLAPGEGTQGRGLAKQAVLYTGLLIPVSLGPTVLGLTGRVYLVGAVVAGVLLFSAAVRTLGGMDGPGARRVFFGSLAYQPVVLLLMVLDTMPA